MINLRKSVLDSTKWTSLSFIVVTLLQFLQYVLLARILGPSAMGQIAVLVVVNGLADLIVGMGIAQAIIQRQGVTSKELSSLFWLNCVLTLSMSIVMFLLAPVIGNLFGSGQSTNLIRLASPLFVITGIGQISRAMLEKKLAFRNFWCNNRVYFDWTNGGCYWHADGFTFEEFALCTIKFKALSATRKI